MYLSKTDYVKRYTVCPSYLWLCKYKPEVVPTDEEEIIKARLEQGNEIERYARLLFPEGILIESKTTKAKVDTEKAVAEGATTLFQATVITESGLLAMADVIKKDPGADTWILYEVKSTN